MKCPHCAVAVHLESDWIRIGKDCDGDWGILRGLCPSCNRLVLKLMCGESLYTAQVSGNSNWDGINKVKKSYFVRPIASMRPPCPQEVPTDVADDYLESCTVLPFSPKASAALSRRCLQHTLRKHASITVHPSLSEEINEFINRSGTPSHLAETVDAIRNIGNFAAHPIKNTNTGEILPVESGEAEWNLDVLEELLDFLFVQPARVKNRRNKLNTKLKKAGKPPMK